MSEAAADSPIIFDDSIPVVDESEIKKAKPQFVLILPWNLKNEITQQLIYIRDWGAKFVIPIPEIEII